jgi:hypothetical protein
MSLSMRFTHCSTLMWLTVAVSNREQIIDRLFAVFQAGNPERDSVDLFTLARAMLATYEATLACIASREGAKS